MDPYRNKNIEKPEEEKEEYQFCYNCKFCKPFVWYNGYKSYDTAKCTALSSEISTVSGKPLPLFDSYLFCSNIRKYDQKGPKCKGYIEKEPEKSLMHHSEESSSWYPFVFLIKFFKWLFK